MIYNPTEVNRFGNKYNIDFDHTLEDNEDLDILFFNTLMNKELRLRGLPHTGNLEERKKRLKQHLMIEERIGRIKEAILHTDEGKEAALILIKQAIPCIMHLENRAGEKIITIVLYIGAIRFQQENRSDNLERYVKQIEDLIQIQILGTAIRPKQWRFPLKDNKKEVSILFVNLLFVCFNQY